MQVKICVSCKDMINLNCKTVKILFMSRKHVVDVKHGTSKNIEILTASRNDFLYGLIPGLINTPSRLYTAFQDQKRFWATLFAIELTLAFSV